MRPPGEISKNVAVRLLTIAAQERKKNNGDERWRSVMWLQSIRELPARQYPRDPQMRIVYDERLLVTDTAQPLFRAFDGLLPGRQFAIHRDVVNS